MSRPFAAESAFHAISHPIRRRLLELLRDQDRDVQQLAEHFAVSLSTISQHLQVLRQVGLVTHRRDKQRRVYAIHARGLSVVFDWLKPFEQVTLAGRQARSKS